MVNNFKRFAKFISIALVASVPSVHANASGYGSYEDGGGIRNAFSFYGSLESFTKAGFNNAKVDTTSGRYPTESFSTVFGGFNTAFNAEKLMSSNVISKLEFAVGVSGAGLIWSSTELNNNYVGGYFGPRISDGKWVTGGPDRLFIVHNAYMDLETDFGLKFIGGRYASFMEYYSGYTQGFNLDWTYVVGDDESQHKVKPWLFASYGRAFAESQWFLDFFYPKSTTTSSGSVVNYGIYALGADYGYKSMAQLDNGYKAGYSILVRPFLYFYPGIYEAIGLKYVHENHFGNGVGLRVTGQGYFLNLHSGYYTTATNDYKVRQEKADQFSGNLNIIAQLFMYNYNARIGLYQNFGSANSHFGTYGNPLGLDFWTGSVYDIGPSLNDVVSRSATTVYMSGGGSYDTKLGELSWMLLGAITQSARSDEERISLSVNHTFKNNISLGLKAEWLRDTTKAGYNPGDAFTGSSTLGSNRTDDRSHIFATFAYNFSL